MDHISYPHLEVWQTRRDWFESVFDIDGRGGAYTTGEHATGLLVDLQAIYCAGAFVSVIIMACTIADAQLREAELGENFEGGMMAAFDQSSHSSELEWLRKRRNELVHFKKSRRLAITVEDHYLNREQHQIDAKRSINIVAAVLFENPWV